ncbi:hypothetical protein FHS61_001771 [Altererythrobacter atlanticus]|nr:hypothetical protein [Croceibacterium atlanticum]MBB5732762.1 hypothetical protein [Croceibacterium atlanticum]
MNSLAAFIAPLALLLPIAVSDSAAPQTARLLAEKSQAGADLPLAMQSLPDPVLTMERARRTPRQNQVRIEQRVIIRIAPGPAHARDRLLADLPRRPMPQRYQEEKIQNCVPISAIAGVQPANENRLLLFMRDRRILSAALERACNAQDFYSGFYVERNDDGQLCSGRDQLQSRAGSACKLKQLNRLVAISN